LLTAEILEATIAEAGGAGKGIYGGEFRRQETVNRIQESEVGETCAGSAALF